jgi:hypothetical protein
MGGKSRGRRGVTLDEWLQADFMQHISMSVVFAESVVGRMRPVRMNSG